MTIRVRLLGRPRIEDDEQPCPQPRGLKSWALIARLALTDRAVSRHELASEFFSNAEDPLGALRWSLADVRRSLHLSTALRGDPLRLSDADIWLDVWDLEAGLLPSKEIGTTFLEGVDLRHCPGFDTWLLLARSRAAARSLEELRSQALHKLELGAWDEAVAIAGQAARLDPLNEPAQELFLRALVSAGHPGQASVHWAACSAAFAREGLVPSPALRDAAQGDGPRPPMGKRAGIIAGSLLRAGTEALAAGAANAGIETLRRAAKEAERARDSALEAEVLTALGGALVHAVRGADGEGAVVLHRALAAARTAKRTEIAAEILRQLAFVDLQAGRHSSADRALHEAAEQASTLNDDTLTARILAVQGMNAADRGRHTAAATLLTEAAQTAGKYGNGRQQSWSLGVLARSLLLSGQAKQARMAAEASIEVANRERWNAFLPWPQVLRAQALAELGDWNSAGQDAEVAFALACELGDPCWEGMAGRALGMIALHAGDRAAAHTWIADARRRCDRVSDRYVWVSAYIGLADLELAGREGAAAVAAGADRLRQDAIRSDLPEFLAWALTFLAELGDPTQVPLARAAAVGVSNPALQTRVRALSVRRPSVNPTGVRC